MTFNQQDKAPEKYNLPQEQKDSSSLSKKRQIFRQKVFLIIKSVPGVTVYLQSNSEKSQKFSGFFNSLLMQSCCKLKLVKLECSPRPM
jgi:hypothetical protein